MDRFRIDPEISMPWVEVAQSSRILRDVLSQIGDPLQDSAFAHINSMYPTELASGWIRDYLSAAIEHLELWADVAAPLRFHEEAVVVHKLRPVQALARACVESAAQAVWMMDAGNARDCTLRHLCLVLDDIDEERKVTPLGEKHRFVEARQALLDSVAANATEEQIGRFPGYMAIVKMASAAVAEKGSKEGAIRDPIEVERLWRSAAGSSHGKRWPSVALQISIPAEELTSGRLMTGTMPDPLAITQILKLADAVVTYGVVRFAVYAGYEPQLAKMMSDAAARLSAVLPRKDEE
ncbi:MAG TPA: hypothetical protein DCP11_04860 [Microbacteriaceae bacterium]|nr:hypothetical protein [Microbacteriaceae bacterium]